MKGLGWIAELRRLRVCACSPWQTPLYPHFGHSHSSSVIKIDGGAGSSVSVRATLTLHKRTAVPALKRASGIRGRA